MAAVLLQACSYFDQSTSHRCETCFYIKTVSCSSIASYNTMYSKCQSLCYQLLITWPYTTLWAASVFQPFQWSGTLCSNSNCSRNPCLFGGRGRARRAKGREWGWIHGEGAASPPWTHPRSQPLVSKGSAGLPALSKKIKLHPTFAATRRIFL